MSSALLIGVFAGACAGAVMTFFSHIAPMFGAGNFIKDLDRPQVLGRDLSRREAHLLGILVHLCLSAVFGLGYGGLVQFGWLDGFYAIPLFVYAIGITLITGLLVMPWEGHGLFGRKHDPWFMIDAFLTNIVWAVLVYLIAHLWSA